MTNIAIVTSTSFGGSNKDCFKAGLASALSSQHQPTILDPFESDGSYSDLRQLVRKAVNNNPRPDLIVAAGGLEMAQAAAWELQEQDPKFIFMSNDALEGRAVALAGGANINAPGEDAARKALLKSKYPNVQDASMYLVVNNNSPMWPNDAKNWPPARVARFFDGVPNPRKNEQTTDADNHFIAEFDQLAQRKPTPTGLVISADPYFRYWRTAFAIALAEKIPVPVCYPFQEFVDVSARTANKGNSIALDKPPLNNSSDPGDQTTAYFQLGRQVGKFVAGTADVGVVTWNGSEWSETRSVISPPPDERSGIQASGIEIEIRVKGRIDEAALQKVLAALRGMR
jgi:hypothetical protein